MTLAVVCYLWLDNHSKHNGEFIYGPNDAALLKRMVRRNLSVPHRFVCITDDPERFVGYAVDTAPLDMTKHVPGKIFAKLMTFHPGLGDALQVDRVLALDLDTVVVGNLDGLLDRTDPLVLWRNPARQPWPQGDGRNRALYNTSVVLITPGTRSDIWTDFSPDLMGDKIAGDQDWVSWKVGPDCPYWDENDGIYRRARSDTPGSGVWGELPDNARLVTFPGGKAKPWQRDVQEANRWIVEHRR